MSNLFAVHGDKLAHFSGTQKNRVAIYLAKTKRIHPYLRALLGRMMDLIDETTTQADLDLFEETLERAVTRLDDPKIFIVNEGEDFCLEVDLEEGRDFTGYILVAREATNGTLLSNGLTQGTAEDLQSVTINDLSLVPGRYYKIHALLEHPNQDDEASGDASTLLTDAILLVGETIDQF